MLNIFDNNKIKDLDLVEFSITTSGDMVGSYHSKVLKKDNDKLVYIITSAENHAALRKITTYNVLEGNLEDIKNIVLEGHLYKTSKKGMSPIQAMDAATTTYSFYFEPYDSFSISDNQNLNKHDYEYLNKLEEYLNNLKLDEGTLFIEPMEVYMNNEGLNYCYYSGNINKEEINVLFEVKELIAHKEDKYIYDTYDNELNYNAYEKVNEVKAGDIVYLLDKTIRIYYEDDKLNEDAYLLASLKETDNKYTIQFLSEIKDDTTIRFGY